MRFLTLAAAATLLLLPAAGAGMHSAMAASTDYSAAKHKKSMKKTAKVKMEKVEYMRAVPMK